MNTKSLVAELRAAGYDSFADKLRQIDMTATKPGHANLRKAISLLQSNRRFALAERVDQIRIALYGADQVSNSLLGGLLDQLMQAYCVGCDAMSPQYQQVRAQLLQCCEPILEQLVACDAIEPVIDQPMANDQMSTEDQLSALEERVLAPVL